VIGVEHNDAAQRARIAECGYFGFIGTPGLKADDVLRFTRNRDYIEKDYEAYKSRMRRPCHSLDEHLEAKIFLVMGTVKGSLLDAGIPAEVRLDLQKRRKKLGLPPA